MLAILIFALAGSAGAAPLDKAKAAIDNSEYFAARSELETALRAGDNQPAELAEIHKLSGIVAAALGDPKAAKEAFQRCLALAPQTSLPAGTSPKIAKPFTAAQDFLKDKQPLQIKPATTGDPPSVTIEVVSDPLTMIAKLQAIVVVDGKPEQTLDKPVDKQVKIALPKGKRLDLRVVASDEHGNHLVELGTRDVPIVIVGKPDAPVVVVAKPKPKPQPGPYRDRPLYLKWWLWGGASVVFLGASGYFGIDSIRQKNKLDDLTAESANHSFDEAKAIEDDARRSVLITNITLIAGGAFAITGAVLYLTRPRQPEAARSISVAPVVHPTGGGLVLGGHF
jgi:hypothetical protein